MSSTAVVVCRPRWSPSRTSATRCANRPVNAFTNVDFPTPLAPSNAIVSFPPTRARSASTPSPLTPLAHSTGTPAATASSDSIDASAVSASTRSRFVSTMAGSPPLSNASTSSRSRRRWLGGEVSAWTSTTTSMLAAMVCDTARLPSNDARRVNPLERSRTVSTRSWSSLTITQSPTATSAPMLRTRAGSSPGLYDTELQPRSSRVMRPQGRSSPAACQRCSSTVVQPRRTSPPRNDSVDGSDLLTVHRTVA